MKKFIIILSLSLLFLQGCDSKKKEEAIARVQQVECEYADLIFTLNGLWEMEETEVSEDTSKVELFTTNQETGSNILVYANKMDEEKGEQLIRLDDYIEAVRNTLYASEDQLYTLSEVEESILYGKEMKSFQASTGENFTRQQYYIYPLNDHLITMVITSYGEDSLESLLKLGADK